MIQNQWAPLHGETKRTGPLQGQEAATRLTSPKLESHFGRLLNSYRERVESQSGDGEDGSDTQAAERADIRPVDVDSTDNDGTGKESRSGESVTDTASHDPESENSDTLNRSGKPETESDSGTAENSETEEESTKNTGEDSGEPASDEQPVSDSERLAIPTSGPDEAESVSENVEDERGETSEDESDSEKPDLNADSESDGPESAGDTNSTPRVSADSDGSVSVEESSDSEKGTGRRAEADLNMRDRTTEHAGRSGSETGGEANASGPGRNRDQAGETARTGHDGQRIVENGITVSDDEPESGGASGQSEPIDRQESEKNSSGGDGTPDQQNRPATGDSAGTDRNPLSEENAAITENRPAGERSAGSEPNRSEPEPSTKQRADRPARFIATDRSSGNHTERNGSAEDGERLPAATQREDTPSLSIQSKGAEGSGEIPPTQSDEPLTGWLSGHSAEAVEKSIELRNVKAEKIREQKNFKHLERLSKRGETGSGRSESGQLAGERSFTAEVLSSGPNQQQGENLSNPEKEMSSLWQELEPELTELKEGRVSESQPFGMTRLGQIPISNIMIRRNLLPGLTQQVVKAAGAGSGSSEVWQKHNIEIEQGKNVQISVRKTEGVLQLRLGSSNPELNRLMQQYQHEIRQHLEEECGLEVDLQFDNPEEDTLARFFDGSAHRDGIGSGRGPNPASSGGRDADRMGDGDPAPAVRRFGYNQMEWTI